MTASATDPAVFRARDLSVRYGERLALHDVGLEVRPAEFVALTGPNGAGKTTLLRAALGLVTPARGGVELLGSTSADLSASERARRAAWVPQDEVAHENVTVFEYVLFGRYPHLGRFAGEGRFDRERAWQALSAASLSDRAHARIHELSGGERQRALLARALAQDTPILLLDEPTAHLDIGHQLDLLERVRGLCRTTRRCVVAAMHDLNLAARFADRVAVLSHGRLVEDGPPEEVLSEELLRRVWGVVAELRRDPRSGLPYLVPSLSAARSVSPAALRSDRRPGPVHVVGGGGAASAILRALADAGYLVTAGALHLLDSDTETAQELGIPAAVEVPFAPLGAEVRARHRAFLEAARVVVLAPFAVGPANLANLEDVLPFVATRPVYAVGVDSPGDRDFTGGQAAELWKTLVAAGARPVPDVRALLDGLADSDRPLTPR